MKIPRLTRGTALIAALTLGLGAPLPGQAGSRSPGTVPAQASGPRTADNHPVASHAAGQILVTFKPSADAEGRRNAVRSLGDRVDHRLENLPDTALVKLASGLSVAEAVRAYEADHRVAHAQPNYLYRAQQTPDDPELDRQWGLDNTGQTVDGVAGTAGSDIAAPAAWDTRTDCTGSPVAVLDTGINHEHADLAGNMWTGDSNHGRDFVGDANDSDPIPDGGATHGTHVAGTIAAVGNNGIGTAGVCWQGEIMAVRVLGPDGVGYTSDIIEGVQYAVDNGARIINMSLGGPSYDQAFKDALATARDNGVLVTAAAGNAGSDNDADPHYPCSYSLDNIICTAALDQNYDLADYSNYGDQSVDVGAPGTNVLSSFPGPLEQATFSDWNMSDEWAVDTACSSKVDFLVNPEDWCSGGEYGRKLDARAYQTFDLSASTVLGAGFHYYLDLALEDSKDAFETGHFAGAGDPFDNAPTIDLRKTGASDSDGFDYRRTTSLAGCLGGECSVGFRLDTGPSRAANGAAIALFSVRKVTAGAEQAAILDGTSMAAPHVAGIAALAWSQKPDSTYSQIRDAVLQGGDSVSALSGMTVTSRAVDALGTLEALN